MNLQTFNQKTLLIYARHPFQTRIVFNHDFLKTLQENGVRIVALAPQAMRNRLPLRAGIDRFLPVEEFFEQLQAIVLSSRTGRWLRLLRLYTLANPEVIAVSEARMQDALEDLKGRGGLGCVASRFLRITVHVLRRSKIFRKILIRVERWCVRAPRVRELLLREEVDSVLVPSVGNIAYDSCILYEAERAKCQRVSVIFGWDHLTTKGYRSDSLQLVVVFSEIMRDELIQYHEVPGHQIFVSGNPYFDYYSKRRSKEPKEKHDRATLCVALGSPAWVTWNTFVLETICQGIQDGSIRGIRSLRAKIHPQHYRYRSGQQLGQSEEYDLQELARKYSFLELVYPKVLKANAASLAMDETEVVQWYELLSQAAACVSIMSTVNIDASLLDVPAINISFRKEKGVGVARV